MASDRMAADTAELMGSIAFVLGRADQPHNAIKLAKGGSRPLGGKWYRLLMASPLFLHLSNVIAHGHHLERSEELDSIFEMATTYRQMFHQGSGDIEAIRLDAERLFQRFRDVTGLSELEPPKNAPPTGADL